MLVLRAIRGDSLLSLSSRWAEISALLGLVMNFSLRVEPVRQGVLGVTIFSAMASFRTIDGGIKRQTLFRT